MFQIMAPLPKERLTSQKPFYNVGMDVFGPLITEETYEEGYKVNALIFVCLCTRAVHVELVKDLKAPEIFHAMDRFVARRGLSDSEGK